MKAGIDGAIVAVRSADRTVGIAFVIAPLRAADLVGATSEVWRERAAVDVPSTIVARRRGDVVILAARAAAIATIGVAVIALFAPADDPVAADIDLPTNTNLSTDRS